MPHSAKSISIIDMIETRTILRTISKQLSKTLIRTSLSKFNGSYKKKRVFGVFSGVISYRVALMSTFEHNRLRTIEAQIVQKLLTFKKNNEARPKFTGSY